MKGISVRYEVVINGIFVLAQILLSLYFGLETVRSAMKTGEISISWMLCSWLFVIMGTMLAYGSWRISPEVGGQNTLMLYINGVLIYSITLTVSFLYGQWDYGDTWTMGFVSICIGAILIMKNKKQIPWKNSILKATIAMSAKGIPQLIFALEIWIIELSPLPWKAVAIFHILTILRILQVIFQKGNWNTDRKWLLGAEIVNEATWCLVTIAIFFNTGAAHRAARFLYTNKKDTSNFVSLSV